MNVEDVIVKLKTEYLDYWEEAKIYKEITDSGMTQEHLAKMLGLKQATICNKIRLLKLPEEARKVLQDKNVQERTARSLLRLGSTKLQLDVIEHICKYNLDVNKAGAYIARLVDAHRCSGNVREFIAVISQAIQGLKENGQKVSSKKIDSDRYTDLIIRLHK